MQAATKRNQTSRMERDIRSLPQQDGEAILQWALERLFESSPVADVAGGAPGYAQLVQQLLNRSAQQQALTTLNQQRAICSTNGKAFVNRICARLTRGRTCYFARLALITGIERDDTGKSKYRCQHVSVLVSDKLEGLAQALADRDSPLGTSPVSVSISGLHFEPNKDDAKYLDSEGILESIQF